MKILLFTLCLTAAAFAAPPNFQRVPANGNIWDFQSSVLDDFDANLRRMRDEFDQLEKSLESRFKFPNIEQSGFPSIDQSGFAGIDETGVRIFENGTNIFNIDPSNVKNKSVSDTKIVDDKVVHTEEKVIANGNSVVHLRTVKITPKDVPSVVVHSSSNDDDQPPKTPEVTPSKNDVDSEHVDNDDNSYHPSRDVEEIDNVRSVSASKSGAPQKQIYVL